MGVVFRDGLHVTIFLFYSRLIKEFRDDVFHVGHLIQRLKTGAQLCIVIKYIVHTQCSPTHISETTPRACFL